MNCLLLLSALALAGCATMPAPLPPPDVGVRPVVARDNLQGRWTITEVNGQPVRGYWLELGAEGLTTARQVGSSIIQSNPQPETRAHVGCNDWSSMGWVRNGDKLRLSGGRRTERGCVDPVDYEREEQAGRILSLPMTMELTPPNRLRLVNEAGTLDLVRYQGVG